MALSTYSGVIVNTLTPSIPLISLVTCNTKCTSDIKFTTASVQYKLYSSIMLSPVTCTLIICAINRAQVRSVVRLSGLKRARVTPQSCKRSVVRMKLKPKAYMAGRGFDWRMPEGEKVIVDSRNKEEVKRYQRMWVAK